MHAQLIPRPTRREEIGRAQEVDATARGLTIAISSRGQQWLPKKLPLLPPELDGSGGIMPRLAQAWRGFSPQSPMPSGRIYAVLQSVLFIGRRGALWWRSLRLKTYRHFITISFLKARCGGAGPFAPPCAHGDEPNVDQSDDDVIGLACACGEAPKGAVSRAKPP